MSAKGIASLGVALLTLGIASKAEAHMITLDHSPTGEPLPDPRAWRRLQAAWQMPPPGISGFAKPPVRRPPNPLSPTEFDGASATE